MGARQRVRVLALALVLAGCAQSQGLPPEDAPPPAPPSREPGSVRVTRAELIERLRMPLSRSNDGLEVEPLGGGRARVRLQGRAQHAVMARVGGDGRVRISCVDSAEGAERALAPERAAR